VVELIKRTEHLRIHMEAMREELDQLRQDLHRMQCEGNTALSQPREGADCLAVALALAEDLGSDFASEDPHGLSGRGEVSHDRQ
jgi:hypothetical protein